MVKGRPGKSLLMLDKDDITNVCGCITSTEVRNELHLTLHQFKNFMDYGKVFRGRYILIEDYEQENKR